MLISLPPDYRPSEDEEFMNPLQLEYFRQKLLRWRGDLLKEADGTLASLLAKAASWKRTSPTAPASKPTGRWNCAPATAPAS